jgi:CRISPR-associated protein Cas2
MVYLICYDIVSQRRRCQIAKALSAYGMRVQKSVFECVLDERQHLVLNQKLEKLLNSREDQIRFYPLPCRSRQQMQIIGIQPQFQIDAPAFIV